MFHMLIIYTYNEYTKILIYTQNFDHSTWTGSHTFTQTYIHSHINHSQTSLSIHALKCAHKNHSNSDRYMFRHTHGHILPFTQTWWYSFHHMIMFTNSFTQGLKYMNSDVPIYTFTYTCILLLWKLGTCLHGHLHKNILTSTMKHIL